MDSNSEMKEPHAAMVAGIRNCPYCNSTVYIDETICRYCDKDLAARVCPYCKNTIPSDEDPCHFCGRLEPAENIAEIEAAERADLQRSIIISAVFMLFDILTLS
jgi:predicted amidophosphoribosyltransferase